MLWPCTKTHTLFEWWHPQYINMPKSTDLIPTIVDLFSRVMVPFSVVVLTPQARRRSHAGKEGWCWSCVESYVSDSCLCFINVSLVWLKLGRVNVFRQINPSVLSDPDSARVTRLLQPVTVTHCYRVKLLYVINSYDVAWRIICPQIYLFVYLQHC